MRWISRLTVALSLISLVLPGCGTDTDDPGDAVTPPPTFAQVYDIFDTRSCAESVCHGKNVSWTPLSDIDEAYDNLLGDATLPGCGLTKLVVPGDPESSLLYVRVSPELDPDRECGNKMPQGSTGLLPDQAQVVYDWIAGGALR